jgi:hypothetical protein
VPAGFPRWRGVLVFSVGLPVSDGDSLASGASRASAGDAVSAPPLGAAVARAVPRVPRSSAAGGLAVSAPVRLGDAVACGLVGAVARGLAAAVARGLGDALPAGEAVVAGDLIAPGEAVAPGLAVAPALAAPPVAVPVVVEAPVVVVAPETPTLGLTP